MRVCVIPVLLFASVIGCRSAVAPESTPSVPWDIARAEVIRWRPDDPAFAQEFALEASGMASSRRFLWVPSEKYGRLLMIKSSGRPRVRTVPLSVRRHSELEGVALVAGGVILCDEAHAAVYEVMIDNEEDLFATQILNPLPVSVFSLEGVSVRGGKIGFEGIEVNPDDGTVYLLLERSGDEDMGCVSRIWSLHRTGAILRSDGNPIDVTLEDCTWRLTGLAWWNSRLIALKTKFPGELYKIVSVDLRTGDDEVLLDPTDLLRSLAGDGWSNNVEGIAVGDDGSLWLVADNAVTGVIDDPLPPRGESRTLLLRIPPARASSQ